MILSRRYFINLIKRYYFTNSFLYFLHLTNIFLAFPRALFMQVFNQKSFSLFSMYLFPTFQVTVFSSSMKNSPNEIPTFLILWYIFPVFHTWLQFRLFFIFIYISRIRPTRTAKMSIISLIPSTLSKDQVYDQIYGFQSSC